MLESKRPVSILKRLDPRPYIGPIGSKENPYRHDYEAPDLRIQGSLRVKRAAEATLGHPINIDYYSKGKK